MTTMKELERNRWNVAFGLVIVVGILFTLHMVTYHSDQLSFTALAEKEGLEMVCVERLYEDSFMRAECGNRGFATTFKTEDYDIVKKMKFDVEGEECKITLVESPCTLYVFKPKTFSESTIKGFIQNKGEIEPSEFDYGCHTIKTDLGDAEFCLYIPLPESMEGKTPQEVFDSLVYVEIYENKTEDPSPITEAPAEDEEEIDAYCHYTGVSQGEPIDLKVPLVDNQCEVSFSELYPLGENVQPDPDEYVTVRIVTEEPSPKMADPPCARFWDMDTGEVIECCESEREKICEEHPFAYGCKEEAGG